MSNRTLGGKKEKGTVDKLPDEMDSSTSTHAMSDDSSLGRFLDMNSSRHSTASRRTSFLPSDTNLDNWDWDLDGNEEDDLTFLSLATENKKCTEAKKEEGNRKNGSILTHFIQERVETFSSNVVYLTNVFVVGMKSIESHFQ